MMKGLPVAALIAVALTIGACQQSAGDTTPLTPTVVEPPSITESFSGTVAPKGSSSVPFTVSQVGTISVTLTAAGPPATITMGLGVGTPDASGVCQVVGSAAVLTQAGTTPQLSGTVAQTGTYCVLVFDASSQTATITYSVRVTHPK